MLPGHISYIKLKRKVFLNPPPLRPSLYIRHDQSGHNIEDYIFLVDVIGEAVQLG